MVATGLIWLQSPGHMTSPSCGSSHGDTVGSTKCILNLIPPVYFYFLLTQLFENMQLLMELEFYFYGTDPRG